MDDLELTQEQQLMALMALSGQAVLKMRGPEDWYCEIGLEIAENGMLRGGDVNGTGPMSAIEATWKSFTNLPLNMAVCRSRDGKRTYHRWNGFMWVEVERPS